jgi:hypothetical protein
MHGVVETPVSQPMQHVDAANEERAAMIFPRQTSQAYRKSD